MPLDKAVNKWDFEHKIELGSDVREPWLIELDGVLHFSFFEAGQTWFLFQPKFLYRIQRNGFQDWTEPEKWGKPGEIVWQYEQYQNKTYLSSYDGTHYQPASEILLHINYTEDSKGFEGIESILVNKSAVYNGGISEVGFTFTEEGDLVAAGRNEDGDQSGSGTRFFKVTKESKYQDWEEIFPTKDKSDPDIVESPRMFKWKNYQFLVARRDLDPPYDRAPEDWPFVIRKYWNLVTYSLRAHTTAIWFLDPKTMKLKWLMDIPGCGDNAFPSIIQTSQNRFTIANYSNKLQHKNWPWIVGQFNPTQIYFIDIELTD